MRLHALPLLLLLGVALACVCVCVAASPDAAAATSTGAKSSGADSEQVPPQLPSYAVHADPHKTRPANLPPQVPTPTRPQPPTGGPTAPDAVTQPPPEAIAQGAPVLPPEPQAPAAVPVPKNAPAPVAGPAGPAGMPASATPTTLNHTLQITGNARATNPDLAHQTPQPTLVENSTAPETATASAAGNSAAVPPAQPSRSGPTRTRPSPPDPNSIIESDDPHSLPIPSSMHGAGGGAGVGGGAFPMPHDPLIHVTPPPSGGWRAGQIREQQQQQQQQGGAKSSASASPNLASGPSATGTTPSPAYSNSYISAQGPSEAFRRNSSRWFEPPALHGPVPHVDARTYKPSGAPEYWVPDSAHIQMLAERHEFLQDRHEKRRSKRDGGAASRAAARTTRLAALDPSLPHHRLVEIRDRMLYVADKPFWIQGICYSPVPIGESVSFAPRGDYFTPDFAYIWQRDLPLIKAMGATTLRIYGWAAHADHTAFLDAVEAAGLKVLVTFYLGDAEQNPVATVDQRNQLIIDFVAQVHMYREHPAILMWSFGNELNGAWNGFAKQFSDSHNCWWQAGCAGYGDTNSDCHWQSTCMYYHMFSWINSACRAAKMVTTRPIISGFADVDYMVGPTPWLDKVARFDWVLPDMDAWAVQLYRGWSFGGYFDMYRNESPKPMIVTEFGVDAYNDACGWPENNAGGCFNMNGDAAGGADDNGHFWGCASGGECAKPGVQSQSEWDVRLAAELMHHYVTNGGIVWGGFLMAWTDEFWKGAATQDLCAYPCKTWDADYCRGAGIQLYKPGGGAMCSWKAHFTCPNFDTNYHDLCGYWLAAAPDNYVNEEWFGITSPGSCGLHKVNPDGVDGGYKLDTLYVRPAYIAMMQLWSGNTEVDTSHTTCAALKPCWACAVTHSMEELNEGACEIECTVKSLAVGPGSSVIAAREREGFSLLRGQSHPDSFLAEFGLPLIVAAAILLAATSTSIYLWRRHAKKQEEAGEPLLR